MGATSALEKAYVMAALNRFQDRFFPARRPRLAAGRADAVAIAAMVFTLERNGGDVRAERRVDTVKAVAQIRTHESRRQGGIEVRENVGRIVLLECVAAPGSADDGIAFNHFLQAA